MTTGIKIFGQHKRDLYLLCRSTNDPKLKNHYKTYCRILSEVIKTAKNYIIIISLQTLITKLSLYGTLLKWWQKKVMMMDLQIRRGWVHQNTTVSVSYLLGWRHGSVTNVLILYIFSPYIFVTWGWPTVAKTCRQPNK